MRRSRYLYKNSGVIRGLVERMVTHIVGCGINAMPASIKKAFNASLLALLKEWDRRPTLDGRFSRRQIQRMIVRACLVDGQIFAYLTGKQGNPKLTFIRSHLIGKGYSNAYSGLPDGINVDASGTPVSYDYYPEKYDAKPILLPAESVIHFKNPINTDEYHGVTVLHAALVNGQDYHEIIAMEKAACKRISMIADVIETQGGEMSAEDLANSNGDYLKKTTDESTQHYKQAFGPETKIVNPGDKYVLPESNRPSPAWQGLMELIANTICISANIPPSMVLPMKMGGVDKRFDAATLERVVEDYQLNLVDEWTEVINWVIDGLLPGSDIKRVPDDYKSLSWQFPTRVTADYGREASSDRDDVRMGMLSLREYFGRYGQDYVEQMTQIADEQKMIHDLAGARDLEPWEIQLKNPNQTSQPNPDPAAQANDQQSQGQNPQDSSV